MGRYPAVSALTEQVEPREEQGVARDQRLFRAETLVHRGSPPALRIVVDHVVVDQAPDMDALHTHRSGQHPVGTTTDRLGIVQQ